MKKFLLLLLFSWNVALQADEPRPLLLGFDGEYGLKNSTSAQAIEMGLRLAMDEINAAGGVLNGRPLELRTLDNRSVPARGIENIKTFAAMDDLVAVVGGRFSPVQLAALPTVHAQKVILFNAWGSADGITNHEYRPSYTFRLSLKDDYAMPVMLEHALERGLERVALLLPNTGWGRSNNAAAERYLAQQSRPQLVATQWYNWGDPSLASHYQAMRAAGAQAVILVANDIEGSLLLRYMATLPEDQRLPIISHWGVTGGRLVESAQGALDKVNFSVIQTFSLFSAQPEPLQRLRQGLQRSYGITSLEEVESPVGLGHAYDIVHLLAMAINQAGSADRAAVRDALEHLGDYQGLVRQYQRPFTPENHDALKREDVFMARYDHQGVIRPLSDSD